ncbi:MAG: LysR family transcriptional regulator [Coprobacillaceae bacterium]
MFNKQIKFFIMTVEEGSFSAAGRKLLLSQSAISQQISLLEEELGVSLFNRQGYRPILTKAGEAYYQGCKEIINNYQALEEKIQMLTSNHEILKIGITGPLESTHVPYIVKTFKEKFKDIEVNFIKSTFHNCIDLLQKQEIDIAFGIENDFKNKKNLQYHLLLKHQVCIICSYAHRFANKKVVDIKETIKEPIISFSKTFGKGFYNDFMNSFKKDGITPKIVKEVDSLDEMILSVKLDEGIAFTSKEVVREEDVAIIDINNSHHQAYYAVGYHIENKKSYVLPFIDITIKYFNKTL